MSLIIQSIFVVFALILLFPSLEAKNRTSKNSSDDSLKKSKNIIDNVFDGIMKGIDIAYDKILEFFDKYLSFSTKRKPPKDEDPDVKKWREKIAGNQERLSKFLLKNSTAENATDAEEIVKENIRMIHKLSRKINNTRIDEWEQFFRGALRDMQLKHTNKATAFDDFLQDLITMENEKPLSAEEANRRQRVQKIRQDIEKISKILKSYENETDISSEKVRTRSKRAIEDFEKLAKEMNRNGMLTRFSLLQLKHRVGQKNLDIGSIIFDINFILKEFQSDPDAGIIMTASTVLKIIKLYLLKYSLIDYLDEKSKKEQIDKANDLLYHSKMMVNFTFREMKRDVPDADMLANITESVKSSSDIFSAIPIFSHFIDKIQEYYGEIYWNGADRLNKAEKNQKKAEDEKSGRKDFRDLMEAHHDIIILIYADNNSKEVQTRSTKIIKNLVRTIRRLGKKLDAKPMQIYAKRIENLTKKHRLDSKRLSKVVGIIDGAERQAKAKMGEDPIDHYVVKLKEISTEMTTLILFSFFLPELTSRTASLVVQPVEQTAWKIVDQRTVQGYNDFEEELLSIRYKMEDNRGKAKETSEGFRDIQKTIAKFINRNKGLM